jgi:hypothetical protein
LNHSFSKVHNFSNSTGAALKHLFLPEVDSLWVYLILGGITFIAVVLRVLELDKPILYDEAFTFINYASRSFKYILASYSAPNNHIFHTVLVGVAYRLFGGQSWILRLPAFSAGILEIPATFLTARRFFSRSQALAASLPVAVMAGFINYSTNGRGYTLVTLFALLLANFGAILVEKQSRSALMAYGITGALGFYTIPVFLYPMAGISLWVAVTYLANDEPWKEWMRKLGIFLGVCALSGLLTLILYSPVIIFGTGLESIIGNEVVESLTWSNFVEGIGTRVSITWGNWMKGLDPLMENLLLGGFLLSVIFYRKASRQKLPMQVFLFLAVTILLALQRVTPFGRVFLYLEAFYLMFAAAGLVWLASLLFRRVVGNTWTDILTSVAVLLIGIGILTSTWQKTQHEDVLADQDLQAEEYVARYITDHIKPEDTIVSTAPVDIQTAYYLEINGIPFERFYQRDHPVKIKNALIVLRKNAKYDTPESVLEFYKLTSELDLEATEFLYEYGKVQVYSVPARK